MHKVFKHETIDMFNKQYSEPEIKHMITHLNYNLGSIITTQKLSLPLCIFIINNGNKYAKLERDIDITLDKILYHQKHLSRSMFRPL